MSPALKAIEFDIHSDLYVHQTELIDLPKEKLIGHYKTSI